MGGLSGLVEWQRLGWRSGLGGWRRDLRAGDRRGRIRSDHAARGGRRSRLAVGHRCPGRSRRRARRRRRTGGFRAGTLGRRRCWCRLGIRRHRFCRRSNRVRNRLHDRAGSMRNRTERRAARRRVGSGRTVREQLSGDNTGRRRPSETGQCGHGNRQHDQAPTTRSPAPAHSRPPRAASRQVGCERAELKAS